jgi:hypothetical protein
MNKFAVIRFGSERFDDGEEICTAACVARFATEAEAESFRARRYGADDTMSGVVED